MSDPVMEAFEEAYERDQADQPDEFAEAEAAYARDRQVEEGQITQK